MMLQGVLLKKSLFLCRQKGSKNSKAALVIAIVLGMVIAHSAGVEDNYCKEENYLF